jgi:hypothetical protein
VTAWEPALRQFSKAILEQHLRQVSTHVERFSGSETDTLWSSMRVYIYPITHLFSKKLNFPIGSQKLSTGLAYITVILQKNLKKSKNIGFFLVNSFMEFANSFKDSEITREGPLSFGVFFLKSCAQLLEAIHPN